ncbi:MAG TPA: CoA-acylating methylmalonate-semialdehyde dehydrogenase [Geminicoccus sp.]|jgi:malonate-semialdehyde dehydrogenase (acetylating)/methylmalonate-semialdehyde dehydrogenase|uniref:CoA-acylating methylmalonate-semialdehyde dehydrogenase n=1 Tax=Geminicoccus sp. TaxID=2024832 RepID=UPI002E3557B3|nr:CoA-acylating methylmalonate-semialdehyde dehydrogenase [Geminicoccus sp.]HEX2529502.1 CoA-acylating methylmalonate-semialdehyde dehydrogenase [Geminicoccus sp.]
MKEIGHLIGGKRVAGTSGRFGNVFDPAIGEISGKVALADASEVDQVVANSKAAFETWSTTPVTRRARIMFRLKELIERDMEKLAALVSAEHGKTIEDAKGSVTRGLEVVEFACGIPQLLKGEISVQVATGVDIASVRYPVGVCAGITPFNFPAMVPLWMAPVAIATGNCFIHKPSEKVPSAGLHLAELALEAGLPEGVWNVVNGDKVVVDRLLSHPDIAAISFVGSTPIAEYVFKTGTTNGKRVQALGGAKNHMIIMPDADMDQAVDALMGAGYGSAGERCMAVSVAVPVGDKTADILIEKLAPKVRQLEIGPGSQPGAEMGPLVTREHLDKVRGYVDLGVQEGADLVVDGRDFRMQGYENGFFMGGCLFDRVTTDMRIYKEEIFGPVLSVVRKDSFDSALKIINDHEYGNGTAIFTRDGDAARTFVNGVNVGMVGVNVPIPVPLAFHSFGGWKRSLFGDHHAYGPEGVRFYTRVKATTSRWPTGIRAGAEFVMPTMR